MINTKILFLQIDNKRLSFDDFHTKKTLIGEKIKLVASDGYSYQFSVDVIPHFIGETDIEIIKSKKIILDEEKEDAPKIKKIRRLFWNPKGLRIFSKKYLVQIELELSNKKFISIGLFYKKDGSLEFLGTGEITLSLNFSCRIDDYDQLEEDYL